MAIRLEGVTVLCDATCKACEHRCTASTVASLENGQLRVLVPHGWTQEGDTLLGPNCTEERALKRIHEAELPDPAQDPPALAETREKRLGEMREVIRADLEGREAEFSELREYVREFVTKNEGDVPDFLGHVGNGMKLKVEVRVRGNYVEISYPGEQSMSLTLRHTDLVLEEPPAFLDPEMIAWVQNCLRTMTPKDVEEAEAPVAQ